MSVEVSCAIPYVIQPHVPLNKLDSFGAAALSGTRCTGCRSLLEWTRSQSFSGGRLSCDGPYLYGFGSVGSKQVRFRSQPKFQIPPLRVTCFFPKLKSQSGDSVLVRYNFGHTVFIHRDNYKRNLNIHSVLLITYIIGFQ